MEGLSEPDVGPFWVPIQRVSRSTADMEEVGELKDLLAGGVIPAVEVGNLVFSETLLVFGAVDVGIDFGVEALFLQDGEVLAHFSLVLGSAPEKMLEVELDEPVRVGAFEEALAVEAAFGDLADQFAHTQIAATEQGFRALKAIALENVLKTQNLLVNRPNQCGRIGFGGIQPAFLVLRGRETVNAQIGSVDECHGRAGRGWGDRSCREGAVHGAALADGSGISGILWGHYNLHRLVPESLQSRDLAPSSSADTIRPCVGLLSEAMTSLPAEDSWSHRMSHQLQSLSVICETLTLRLLELEERMGRWDEQNRRLEDQTSEQAGNAAALVDVLEATGQRLASLEALLEGVPTVAVDLKAAPPRLQVLHAQPRRRAQHDESVFEASSLPEASMPEASSPASGFGRDLFAAEAGAERSGSTLFGLHAEAPPLSTARSMPAALQRPERPCEADDVFPEDEEQRFMDELTA
jgi:hypothetical protein